MPVIRETYSPPQKVYFVQAPCQIHMARRCFLLGGKFEVVQLPPKGADLNPIENIWGVISRRIYVLTALEFYKKR